MRKIDKEYIFSKHISEEKYLRRLTKRLKDGRLLQPCDRECAEYGIFIAKTQDHASFQNFNELMNDSEFLLKIATLTPNPETVNNYFCKFINPYLMNNNDFRLKLLKALYLNDEVYTLQTINYIVETYGLEQENAKVLADNRFKKQIELKLNNLANPKDKSFNLDGSNKKAMRKHKAARNDAQIKLEKMRNGLQDIINSFDSSKSRWEIWEIHY